MHPEQLRGYKILAECGARACLARVFGGDPQIHAKRWGRRGVGECYTNMGITIDYDDGGFVDDDPARPVVAYLPHPRTAALFAAGNAVANVYFPQRQAIPLIKLDHWWNPLGWGIWGMGGILLGRNNTAKDKARIHRGMRRIRGKPACIVQFWDGHRFRPNHLTDVQLYLSGKFKIDYPELASLADEVLAELRYTLLPRPGGILSIQEALSNPRYVEIAITFDRSPGGNDITLFEGATLHVRLRETFPPIGDGVEFREWMLRRCLDYHRWMRGKIEPSRRVSLAS